MRLTAAHLQQLVLGPGQRPAACLRPCRFTSPLHHRAAELAGAEGRDDEPALAKGGTGPGMAVATQGDQLVAMEVRAALGALPEVMHLEAVRGETARLAPPAGAGQDLGPDLAPGLETGRGPPNASRTRQREACPIRAREVSRPECFMSGPFANPAKYARANCAPPATVCGI
jgi:hypothetical protein